MTTKTTRRRVKFQIQADANSHVAVAGSFNGWDPTKHVLKLKDGVFAINLFLEPGEYQYKFVVNDVWCVDPECPGWAPNGHGSMNSVLVVK
jgi:1,4-alpha-glucan branching enzyme